MRRIELVAVLVTAGCALAPPARALDGERRGFFVAAGLGTGMAHYSVDRASTDLHPDAGRNDHFSLASDVRIGYGITVHSLVQAFHRAVWYRRATPGDGDVTIAAGVTGLSYAYYKYPLPPTVYLTVGGGLATWDAPFERDVDLWAGPGATAGLGYEFSDRWALEGTAMWGRPATSRGQADADAEAVTIVITINATAY